MLKFFLTLGSLVFIVLFGFLKTFWQGFVYFSFAIFVAICLYWLYLLIKSYIFNFSKNLQERYNLYCANLINTTNLTMIDISENNEKHFKNFKRSLLKEKLFQIFKMLVVISILISCAILLFSGKLF